MIARSWHGLIAVLVLAAVVLQIVIAVRISGTPPDVSVGVVRGSSLIGRIIRVLSFFTIQSNLLAGIVSARLVMRPDQGGPVWRPLRLAALVGITVTGIVYSTVLAAVHQPSGAAETAVNTIVHYVVPVLMVLGRIVFGPRPRVDWRSLAWSLLFRAAWLVYTLARGAIWSWYPYPYPFLDVTTHGYGRVVLNAAIVTVVLGIVAGLFALLDRLLPAAPRQRAVIRPAAGAHVP